MQSISGFLVAALIATAQTAGAGLNPEQWKDHAFATAKFSIALPGNPITQPGFAFSRMSDGKSLWVMAMWQKIEIKLDDRKKISDYLQGAQAGILNAAKGDLIKESMVEVEGHPSRDFSFRSAKYGFVRTRVILGDSQVYTISYYGESEELLQSRVADRFFGSFKTLK